MLRARNWKTLRFFKIARECLAGRIKALERELAALRPNQMEH
jgi:hypothetical protein